MKLTYSPASYGVANRFGYSKVPPREVLERECQDEARRRNDYRKLGVVAYVEDRASVGEDWAVRCIARLEEKRAKKARKSARKRSKYKHRKQRQGSEVDRMCAYVRRAKRHPIGAPHPDYVRDDDFYNTREWREVRMVALKAASGRCACCGASAKDGAQLHVDHIKPRYKRPDLSLDPSNLQVLCKDCNLGKGAWDDTDWR